MSQTMLVEIPEQSYRKLADLAERRGQSPEALVANTIEQITQDPFEKWIGALPTDVSDGIEHEDASDWERAVARGWAVELEDERQDIYTLQDGEPVDATR